MSKTADAIVVPTEAVRAEVCEHLHVGEQKVFAVPEAAREFFRPVAFAETSETRQKLGIGNEFILTVGTIEPRKNIPTLVRAFEQLALRQPNLKLVIAGGNGWLSGPSFEAIKNSRAAERIVLPGYLHDAALRDLYSSCSVFVYPSLYEGFGLPPIEAMACGAPVVVNDIPALVESTGGAARLTDAGDPGELAQAIWEVLNDDNEGVALSRAGRSRAAELSWTQAAVKTMQVYESLL